MKWYKRMVARWVQEANGPEEAYCDTSYAKKSSYANSINVNDSDSNEFKNPLNITLYNATGGRIVKFHSYNRRTDQKYETTYIIPSDEEFEKALGQFITLEAMKHVNDE